MSRLAQMNTPHLTEVASDLTYTVDQFKGWWLHSGHILLARVECLPLAGLVDEML
ncbi:hypothetical protein [Lampropedia puyangensis]|uniref:hypothetical protein n=1 Tax=Lampropedia puyangensis TaxID=1330072 RepID=UPI0013052073